MIGDTVDSILHTAFAGSWFTSPTAVVGAGVEFDRLMTFADGTVDIALDISDTSFTLIYTNALTGTTNNPAGDFNLGLDGFEFTDLAQNFTGIVFAGSTGGFPVASITGSIVTPTNIQIARNEPIISGGEAWTATWDVEFGAVASAPEPATIFLAGLALAPLALRYRRNQT
jgi:hypothetical protein